MFTKIFEIIMYINILKKIQNNKEGEKNQFEKIYRRNLSFIIPINKKKSLHIHHWILSLILLKKIQNKRIRNLLIATTIQGLLYKDRMKILKKNLKKDYFLNKIE